MDPVLGFFLDWIALFARECEEVHVVCLREGRHALPHNVSVHSLGKPSSDEASPGKGMRFFSRIGYIVKLYWYLLVLHRRYDVVFVHMNPEYVVLGSLWWRMWGRRIGLWYVHSSVTKLLRIAEKLSDIIFTTSPESFKIPSGKVRIMGHGIPVGLFSPSREVRGDDLRIVTVGRVSETKRIREMIDALDELYRRGVRFTFTIVGAPVTDADKGYQRTLHEEIARRPYLITCTGPVEHADIPHILARADLSLNLSATQSMDKAGLESFAAGVPLVSSNHAYQGVLEPMGLYCADNQPMTIADAIGRYLKHPDKEFLSASLRTYVEKEHSLSRLIPAIMRTYVRN